LGSCNILGAFSGGGGGGLTVNKLQGTITSDFTTTSTSFVDTGLDLTLSNQTDGNALIIATFNGINSTDAYSARFNLSDDGTQITSTNVSANNVTGVVVGNLADAVCLTTIADTDGSVISVYTKSAGGGAGTAKMIYSANNYTPQIIAMEFY